MKKMPLAVAILGMGAIGSDAAWAQAYPSKPSRVVVPFAPGGATDVVGRLAFQRLSEQLGQQFLIDNRTGATGTLGATNVAKSAPDGYTLLVYSATMFAAAHMYSKLPYDVLKDFIGLSPVARMVGMLTVHPSMPVQSPKDLIALAKARPGEILYGSGGPGAFQHLATVHLLSMTGTKMTHVPYKGGAPATAAMIAGEVQVMLTPASEVVPYLKSGRLQPVAVSSAERISQFPKVPAIAESVKGFEWVSWMGTFAPAGTPRPIVEKLNAELKKAVEHPETASKLSSLTLDPMYMSLEDFAKHLSAENDKYARVVKLSGVRID
jgi:tripartite-type tricarboxylate transporter receptor subunit TctC